MIHLITSDEVFLVEENAHLILKKARMDGYEEHIIIDAEMPDAVELFLSHRQNFSLFSTKKIIDVRFKQKISVAFSTLMMEICLQPDLNQIILLRMPKLSRAETQQKWYKAIEQHGNILTLWSLKGGAFLNWIQSRFQKYHLKTSQEVYRFIANNTEGNLLAASQVIEKLRLIYQTETITEIPYETIKQFLSDHTHYDVFELCDAALNQNSAHCLKILATLKNQGSEPAIILWALMQDIRKLATLFFADPRNRSSVYQKQGIWSTRQALFQKSLKTFNALILNTLIQKAKEADSMIKGAVVGGNIWMVLEDFCLILSNPAILKLTQHLQ